MSAFLTTPDGVVIFDAPPNIGHNIRRAVDKITTANGLTNQVTTWSIRTTTQITRERPRCSAGTSSASATRRPGDCCCATTTPPAPSRT